MSALQKLYWISAATATGARWRRGISRPLETLECAGDIRRLSTLWQPLIFRVGSLVSPGSARCREVDADHSMSWPGLLLAEKRAQPSPATLAILAVAPSSRFTGGALLGVLVRMSILLNYPGVFIRSLGSREASGGLALAVGGALRLLALAGFDTVLLETVGAGQSELEVAHFASTVCVLHAPGLGDEVQWMKAGILEAADVLVVFKRRSGPRRVDLKMQRRNWPCWPKIKTPAAAQRNPLLQAGLALPEMEGWTPPVVQVSALKQEGLGELLKNMAAHAAYLERAQLSWNHCVLRV